MNSLKILAYIMVVGSVIFLWQEPVRMGLMLIMALLLLILFELRLISGFLIRFYNPGAPGSQDDFRKSQEIRSRCGKLIKTSERKSR